MHCSRILREDDGGFGSEITYTRLSHCTNSVTLVEPEPYRRGPNVPLPALAHTHNSSLKLLMACFHEHILFPDGGHE